MQKVLTSTKFELFLVLGDTKISKIGTCFIKKVFASTKFEQFSVLGDTKLIRQYS
ncbi:MAG: hypothetical protein IKO26_12535 [Paludibacteraceae bacterium]|nr:hypothetical protein [Paludibacteraceae bacterium]